MGWTPADVIVLLLMVVISLAIGWAVISLAFCI